MVLVFVSITQESIAWRWPASQGGIPATSKLSQSWEDTKPSRRRVDRIRDGATEAAGESWDVSRSWLVDKTRSHRIIGVGTNNKRTWICPHKPQAEANAAVITTRVEHLGLQSGGTVLLHDRRVQSHQHWYQSLGYGREQKAGWRHCELLGRQLTVGMVREECCCLAGETFDSIALWRRTSRRRMT